MNSRSLRRSTLVGLLGLALLGALALLIWFQRGEQAASASLPSVNVPNAPLATTPEPQVPPDAREAPARNQIAAETSAEAQPKAPTLPAATEYEKPDFAAREWLSLRVVDERQEPIFDAELMIRGLSSESIPGGWYAMRGGDSKARTGRDGRARIDYPRWVDLDGKTRGVDLTVSHPDFIPFADTGLKLTPEDQTIVLKQGTTVWLTAWTGTPDHIVPDVTIEVDWRARLSQDGWTRELNGSWSTTRLAAGPHWITVAHASEELGKLASEFTPIQLAENARMDLAIELKPLVALRGRLDDAVPRPIVDGHVALNLHVSDGELGLSSDHETTIAADGTFEIEGLRTASGQVIAACDGWVSKLVPPRTLEESLTSMGPNASEAQKQAVLERVRAEERIAQPVDVAAGALLVIEMERTGELELRVVDEQGRPLPDVSVNARPYVLWNGVGTEFFPWHEWNAVSDSQGLARIDQLPPAEQLWYDAKSDTHRVHQRGRNKTPSGRIESARIESGKLTHAELVLEKIP